MNRLMQRVIAHVETLRPYTLFHVGMIALAGASQVPGGLAASGRLTLVWAAPTLGWMAGLYGSDYLDQELDRVAKPQRPIPSGRMKPKEAFAAMLICLYLGLGAAAAFGAVGYLAAGAVMLLGAAYSLFLKARGLAGNLVRGIPAAVTFYFGVSSSSGQSLVPALLIPALAYVAHDASTNLLGAIRDVEGDRASGYGTLPVTVGATRATGIAMGLAITSFAGLLIYPRLRPVQPGFWPLLAIALVLQGIAYTRLWLAGGHPDRYQALQAHKILVLERLILSAALIAGGAGWQVALLLLAPVLLVTFVAQIVLRDRHEYGRSEAAAEPDTAAIELWANRTLRHLAEASTPGLHGWNRRILVEITDRPIQFCLSAVDGTIRHLSLPEYDRSELPKVEIRLRAGVFARLFLDRSLSPHIALLSGGVRLDAAPADMLRLNTLVTGFLRQYGQSGAETPQIAVHTPVSEPPPASRRLVVLADTTLRDGEQMPGAAFTPEQKVRIARLLDDIGVPLIEAGYPAVSAAELLAVRRICDLGLKASVQVIARPVRGDIDKAVESGAQSVALFIGTSDFHIRQKLRLTPEEVIRKIREGVAYARRFPIRIAFAPEDATRTPLPFLLEACRAAIAEGAEVIGVPDTVGISTPKQIAGLIETLVRELPVPVAAHCHNDFGLATANSLAAVAAGASGIQCSLGGIGERAGNAPLEEVAVALEEQMQLQTGLQLAKLTETVNQLYGVLGMAIPPNKPVVGSNAFTHESGLHVMGVANAPASYEPYPPERVGQRRRILFGKHTGRRALEDVLGRHAVRHDENLCSILLEDVKRRGEAGEALTEDDVVRLASTLHMTMPAQRGGDAG